MIYSVYNFFQQSYRIKETTFADIDSFNVSSFIFKENHVLIEENNPSEKIVIDEEELDGIDRDGIGNLEDLLRLVFISEECWNPKAVVDGGELARNINQKKKPYVLQVCRYPLCDKCYRREYFFNKHLEYCESIR